MPGVPKPTGTYNTSAQLAWSLSFAESMHQESGFAPYIATLHNVSSYRIADACTGGNG